MAPADFGPSGPADSTVTPEMSSHRKLIDRSGFLTVRLSDDTSQRSCHDRRTKIAAPIPTAAAMAAIIAAITGE